jgi:hypothetical protein
MLEDPSNIQYPSPSHGGPAVGGPGGPRLSLGTVMQVWRRLWTSYRWWTVGAAGVVVVLASTVVVVGLHGHNQADTSKGAEQPHHHDANVDTGNSQDKAVSDTTSKDKTASTATDDKKSTKAGGQTGGSTGSTQPTGGGGDTSGSGNTGGCGGVVGAPGGTDPWSGCWPGSANTGVPAGTTLRRVPQDVTS